MRSVELIKKRLEVELENAHFEFTHLWGDRKSVMYGDYHRDTSRALLGFESRTLFEAQERFIKIKNKLDKVNNYLKRGV